MAQLRAQRGDRQEDIAQRARMYGLDWSRSVIAALENGGKELEMGEFLLLCLAVPAPPSELLAGADNDQVRVGQHGLATLTAVRAMYCSPEQFLLQDTVIHSLIEAGLAQARHVKEWWPPLDDAQIRLAAVASEDEVETKEARKLGVEPVDVAVMAVARWGRSLTAERDAQVTSLAYPDPAPRSLQGLVLTPRSLQALRGHVTRKLAQELEADLDRYRKGRS